LDINKILKRNYIRVFFALDKERRVNDCYLFYNESSKLGLKNLVSLFFFLAAKAAYIKNIQVLKFTSLVFLKSVYRRINVNRMLSGGIIFLTGF
ncbi:MAG TPA: hypothetical protein PLA68_12750, partial [Panacibacter sp.]|nr:hypothetical protein [Panacibacter sp.]